jgi:hypothetical protein
MEPQQTRSVRAPRTATGKMQTFKAQGEAAMTAPLPHRHGSNRKKHCETPATNGRPVIAKPTATQPTKEEDTMRPATKTLSFTAFAAAAFMLALAANAAVISTHNFDDQVDGSPDVTDLANSAPITAGVAAVSDLSLGARLAGNLAAGANLVHGTPYVHNIGVDGQVSYATPSSYNNAFADFLIVDAEAASGSQANALSEDSYVNFTVTLEPKYELDLSSFTFNYDLSDLSNGTPRFFHVAINDTQIGLDQVRAAAGGVTFDLSSVTGLTDTVDVKLYIWRTGGDSNNTRAGAFDDLTLNGDLTYVPEPASLGLLALAGGLCLGRRPRHC